MLSSHPVTLLLLCLWWEPPGQRALWARRQEVVMTGELREGHSPKRTPGSQVLCTADLREKFQQRPVLKTACGYMHIVEALSAYSSFWSTAMSMNASKVSPTWGKRRKAQISPSDYIPCSPSQGWIHWFLKQLGMVCFVSLFFFFKWLGVLWKYIVKLLWNSDGLSSES